MDPKAKLVNIKRLQWEKEQVQDFDIWDPWGKPGGGAPPVAPTYYGYSVGLSRSKSKPEFAVSQEPPVTPRITESAGLDRVEVYSPGVGIYSGTETSQESIYNASMRTLPDSYAAPIETNYHRGRRPHPDPEKEARRRQALEIQEILKKQVEEREAKRREEAERRRREEEMEEERLRRQIEEDKRQYEEDQQKIRQRKNKEDSRVRAIAVANSRARVEAEQDRRYRRQLPPSQEGGSEGLYDDRIYETISGSEYSSNESQRPAQQPASRELERLMPPTANIQPTPSPRKLHYIAAVQDLGTQTQPILDPRSISTMTCPDVRSISTQTEPADSLTDILKRNISRYRKRGCRRHKQPSHFLRDQDSDSREDTYYYRSSADERTDLRGCPRSETAKRISFKLDRPRQRSPSPPLQTENRPEDLAESYLFSPLNMQQPSPQDRPITPLKTQSGSTSRFFKASEVKDNSTGRSEENWPFDTSQSKPDLPARPSTESASVKSGMGQNRPLDPSETKPDQPAGPSIKSARTMSGRDRLASPLSRFSKLDDYQRAFSPPVPAVAKRLANLSTGPSPEKWELETSEKTNFEARMLKLASVFSASTIESYQQDIYTGAT